MKNRRQSYKRSESLPVSSSLPNFKKEHVMFADEALPEEAHAPHLTDGEHEEEPAVEGILHVIMLKHIGKQ